MYRTELGCGRNHLSCGGAWISTTRPLASVLLLVLFPAVGRSQETKALLDTPLQGAHFPALAFQSASVDSIMSRCRVRAARVKTLTGDVRGLLFSLTVC